MISSETSRPCFMMSDVFSNVNHHVCWLCFKFLYKSLYKSIQNYHIFILWHRGFLNWGTPKESMFKFSNVHRTFHSKPSINWGYPPLDCVLFWLVSVTPWKSRFLPSKSWKVEKFTSQEISARKVEKIEKFEKSKSQKIRKIRKVEKKQSSKQNIQVQNQSIHWNAPHGDKIWCGSKHFPLEIAVLSSVLRRNPNKLSCMLFLISINSSFFRSLNSTAATSTTFQLTQLRTPVRNHSPIGSDRERWRTVLKPSTFRANQKRIVSRRSGFRHHASEIYLVFGDKE